MLKRLFKETVIYGIAGASSRLIGLLLVPLYTRVFTPSQYGLLDILLTTSAVLVLLSGLQVESGVGRSYYEARQREHVRELVGTGVLLCAGGALVCGAAILVARPFIPSQWLGENATYYLLAVALAILPTQLLNMAQVILRLERMLKQFLILSIGDILTSACLCVYAVVYGGYGIAGVLWSLFASKLIWIGIGAMWLKPLYTLSFSRGYAKEILVYSLPTVPGTIVGWVQNSANRYILAGAMSLFEVGIFGLSVRIASAITMLLTAFRMAWYPYSIEIMNTNEFKQKCARMLDVYWLIGFPICAMVGALGGLLVAVLASKSFVSAGKLVAFLAMGVLWSGTPQIVGLGSEYVRKTYLGLIAYAVGAAINILVLVVTIKQWGLVSAGFATLLSYIVTTIVILVLSQQQHRMPFRTGVLFGVAVCSIALSCWCYWSPAPLPGLAGAAMDAAKKSAVAIALSLLVVSLASTKDDKEKALGLAVSAYKRLVA